MVYSIGIIQNADYLTLQQKRDILYSTAARFSEAGYSIGEVAEPHQEAAKVRW